MYRGLVAKTRVNSTNSLTYWARSLSGPSSQEGTLMSNPFAIHNISKIRETESKFPIPNFISFDGFDTLYSPRQPVPIQYYNIAHEEFGLNKSLTSIESEFGSIYKQLCHQFPNYGKGSEEIKDTGAWWSELIIRLFELNRADPNTKVICDRLLDHFSGAEAYRVYDDVIPTLTKLRLLGIKMVLSSNSDERVRLILDNLGLGKFFETEDIYLSYELEYSKPHKQFFDRVSDRIYSKNYGHRLGNNEVKMRYLENCWHIGDNYEEDFLGAIRSGWNGILLDRTYSSAFFNGNSASKNKKKSYEGCFTEKPLDESSRGDGEGEGRGKDYLIIANNRIVVTKLSQLLDLFEVNVEELVSK